MQLRRQIICFFLPTEAEVSDGLSTKEQMELCSFSMEDICNLEESKPNDTANSFKERIVSKLEERQQETNVKELEEYQQLVESRRQRLIKEGIVNQQEAVELINDPIDQLPTQIQQRQFEMIARETEKSRILLEERRIKDALLVYKDPWVLQKELEMYQHCKERRSCHDVKMRSTLNTLIEIAESKLKQYHEIQGTITKEALEERRRVCLLLGYLRQDMIKELTTVYNRMPDPDPFVLTENEDMPENTTITTPPRSVMEEENIPGPPPTPSYKPRSETAENYVVVTTPPRTEMQEEEYFTPPPTPSYTPRKEKRKKKSRKGHGQKRLTQYLQLPYSQP